MRRSGTLRERFDLRHAIVQAPMAGGATTPAMVVATCRAGALGSIAAAYLSAEQIAQQAAEVRSATDRAFAVNLFAPVPVPGLPADALDPALEYLAGFHERLGLPRPQVEPRAQEELEPRLMAALDSGAGALSFTFGLLPAWAVDAAKERGVALIGTATTVEEAVALERSGVDAVVAQGSEAGGHRGTFMGEFRDALIGTIALVPQVVDAVSVPVIASGGIGDGRGLAAALTLGASAAQLGTVFLTTVESGITEAHRDAILRRDRATRVTRAFSGRPARGLVNEFMTGAEGNAGAILPFPHQNALTRTMRKAAGRDGDAELLSLWAGQAYPLCRREGAGETVERISAEARAVLGRTSAAAPHDLP